MLKYFLLLSCTICTVSILGQKNREADSLLHALDRESTDTGKMKLYNKIGNHYMDNNAGKAVDYLEKAKTIAQQLHLPLQEANNNFSIGFCYLLKGDFDQSLRHYLESVKGYEKLNDSFRLANAFISIGNLYSQHKDFTRTTEYYNKAQHLVEAQKDSSQLINILAQKGIVLDQQKKYDAAIVYLNEALSLARLLGDPNLLNNTISNLGLTYKHQGNTAKALACFDTVLRAYDKANIPVDYIAALYNNIGATQAQAGNFAKAKEAFNQSISLAKEAGSPYIEMENYSNLSDMYGRMKNFELQASFQQKYYTIKDSLFTAGNTNQLTQLEADYQVEKKNAELSRKDAEVSRQTGQRNFFILLAATAAIVLMALAFLYRRIRRTNVLLNESNQKVSQQNVELEKLNQVKDRLFGIISHDLRNPLVTLRSYLSLADDVSLSADKKALFKQTTMQAVAQTCDMLDNLLVWANLQIKTVNPALRPVDTEECILDVVDTVQAQSTQKNITIRTDIQPTQMLGDKTILDIALRNILTNAIKFSHPGTNVFITTQKCAGEISISIRDEGLGINKEQLRQLQLNQTESRPGTAGESGSGLGIFLAKELLQKVNARLIIESEVGKGSCFTIAAPALA